MFSSITTTISVFLDSWGLTQLYHCCCVRQSTTHGEEAGRQFENFYHDNQIYTVQLGRHFTSLSLLLRRKIRHFIFMFNIDNMIWRKGWIEWRNGCFGKMDDPPYQTTTLYQNGCSPKEFCSNHPCGKMVSAAFKYIPQPTAMTFAFFSVFILLLHMLQYDIIK